MLRKSTSHWNALAHARLSSPTHTHAPTIRTTYILPLAIPSRQIWRRLRGDALISHPVSLTLSMFFLMPLLLLLSFSPFLCIPLPLHPCPSFSTILCLPFDKFYNTYYHFIHPLYATPTLSPSSYPHHKYFSPHIHRWPSVQTAIVNGVVFIVVVFNRMRIQLKCYVGLNPLTPCAGSCVIMFKLMFTPLHRTRMYIHVHIPS